MDRIRNELIHADDNDLNIDQLRSKYAPPGENWKFLDNVSLDTVYRGNNAIMLPPNAGPQMILRMNLTIARRIKGEFIISTENGYLVTTSGKEYALGDYAFDAATRVRVVMAAMYMRELSENELNRYRLERQ